MKEITVLELKQLMDNKANFQLIDVRETLEYGICNIKGESIPLDEVIPNLHRIQKDKQVVIHCKSGKRSSQLVKYLEKNYGYTNLYSLQGGITAWAQEVDESMVIY